MDNTKKILPQIEKDIESEKDTESKKIEVPAGLLEELQKELKDLRAEVTKQKVMLGDDVVEDEDDKKAIARLRQYEGKLVIGFNKERGTWFEYDKERREDRLMQEIVLLDDKGEKSNLVVDYLRFRENSKEVEVPVKKITRKEVTQNKGLIRVREVVDYKTVVKKDKVMQKVISSNDTATIVLPDGKEMDLDVDFLNM